MYRIAKNLLCLLLFLGVSLLSSILLGVSFEDLLPYIPPDSLPESPTAFLLGGFFGTIAGIAFNVACMAALAFCILIGRREIRLSDALFLPKNSFGKKVLQILGYAVAAIFVLNFVKEILCYRVVLASSALFCLTAAATALIYTVLLIALGFNRTDAV